MAYQTLKVTTDARGVLTIELNRPDIRNAFNEVMISELARAFGVEALSKDVRAVVLKGAGPVFAAGGDLNWMKRSIEVSRDENLEDTRRLSRMFAVLNDCPKPVIGAVHGAAIGGGVGLVSVCDIVIAVSDTQFSLSEVRLGLVPACIGPFVVAKIGASQARRLFLSADRFSGLLAKEIGLVHELVSDKNQLDSAVERVVGNILQASPNAVNAAKKLLADLTWPERRAKVGDPLEYVSQMLADLRVSPEGQEGLKAFLEKRKPSWQAESK